MLGSSSGPSGHRGAVSNDRALCWNGIIDEIAFPLVHVPEVLQGVDRILYSLKKRSQPAAGAFLLHRVCPLHWIEAIVFVFLFLPKKIDIDKSLVVWFLKPDSY